MRNPIDAVINFLRFEVLSEIDQVHYELYILVTVLLYRRFEVVFQRLVPTAFNQEEWSALMYEVCSNPLLLPLLLFLLPGGLKFRRLEEKSETLMTKALMCSQQTAQRPTYQLLLKAVN